MHVALFTATDILFVSFTNDNVKCNAATASHQKMQFNLLGLWTGFLEMLLFDSLRSKSVHLTGCFEYYNLEILEKTRKKKKPPHTFFQKGYCLYLGPSTSWNFPPPPAYFTMVFLSHSISRQCASDQFQFTTRLRRWSRSW